MSAPSSHQHVQRSSMQVIVLRGFQLMPRIACEAVVRFLCQREVHLVLRDDCPSLF